MGEVIEENDLGRHIRYRHRITAATLVERRRTSGPSRPRAPTPARRVRFTANFLWMCQGYYRHSEGYTPEWPGMDRLQGPHRPSADLARGPRLQGQEGRRHRLRRHRRDARAGDRRRLRARHHAAALADLFLHRPQRQRAGRHAARAGDRRDLDPRDRPPQDPARPGTPSPSAAFDEPETVKQELLAGVARLSRPGLRRRHALHAELPAVAAAHRLRAGRRPVPGHRAPARPRWSPTRSSASPRRASC